MVISTNEESPVDVFQTYAAAFSTWVLGEAMCKVLWYIYYTCFAVSVFTMAAMAFERYWQAEEHIFSVRLP